MPRKVRERTRRDLTSESGPAGPALDPRTGGGAVRAHPAVGEPPATAGAADELVPVAAPVVNPAVGDGEEVAAGAGAIGPVQLDQHVGDVVADAGRPGPGGEVAPVPVTNSRIALRPRWGGSPSTSRTPSVANSSTRSSKRPPSTQWA